MERVLFAISGVTGLVAVALGAFGAHSLPKWLADATDLGKRLEWWQTASSYNLAHALAIALAAVLVGRGAGSTATVAGFCFLAGVVLFSGSLYAMALTGARFLGAVTPFGGLLMIAGWAAVVLAAVRLR